MQKHRICVEELIETVDQDADRNSIEQGRDFGGRLGILRFRSSNTAAGSREGCALHVRLAGGGGQPLRELSRKLTKRHVLSSSERRRSNLGADRRKWHDILGW